MKDKKKVDKKEVSSFKHAKIILTNFEPGISPDADELANVVLCRIGLMPRKQGATDKMHRTLVELYERSKIAYRIKKPEKAVMTVEEMGMYAGISRQTMYDYLKRWLDISLISKASYITDGKVVVGYKLNGNTLEQAFDRAIKTISDNMDLTQKYIRELQRVIKNEKISEAQVKNGTVVQEDIEEQPLEAQEQQKTLVDA